MINSPLFPQFCLSRCSCVVFAVVLFFSSPMLVSANQDMADYLLTISAKAKEYALRLKQRPTDKNTFRQLVLAWKKIESSYILSYYDEDFEDTKFYIDQFNIGKSNLYQALDKIIDSAGTDIEKRLYKNSYKSINAMEYVLFNHATDTTENYRPHINKMLAIMASALHTHFAAIHRGYRDYKNHIIANPEEAIGYLLSVFSQRQYQLINWRIVKVEKSIPKKSIHMDSHFPEYRYSGLSLPAIIAILQVQEALLSLLSKQQIINAYEDIHRVREQLRYSMSLVSRLEKQPTADGVMQLYQVNQTILGIYYDVIIVKLKFIREVLDADGD